MVNILKISKEDLLVKLDEEFYKLNLDLYKEIPNIETNVDIFKKLSNYNLNINRKEMPVVKRGQMITFKKSLENGDIDINPPYTYDTPYFPLSFNVKDKKVWMTLGQYDGDERDDKINVRIDKISCYKLKPTQSEIWLEEIIKDIKKFGVKVDTKKDSLILTSEENYILDGHHRWTRQVLTNPKQYMTIMKVPLNVNKLFKVSKSFGKALGNSFNK